VYPPLLVRSRASANVVNVMSRPWLIGSLSELQTAPTWPSRLLVSRSVPLPSASTGVERGAGELSRAGR
jgi:hypothetical protein